MLRNWSVRLLAAIRIVNGGIALFAPTVFARQMHASSAEGAVQYPFRLFGVRALVNGVELLNPDVAGRWLPEVTVIVHASDLVAATVAGRRGEVSPEFARRTMALSGLNTVLAVVSWVLTRRRAPLSGSGSP
jgi:hypothetical protein